MEAVSYDGLYGSAKPSARRLGEALAGSGARFILECKKASPSKGLIRKNFDIADIARTYKNFADAVSVLTDEPYFDGSLDNLRRAREILDCPILAKDFVLGPYQVREARMYGADAALLMLSVLDDVTYRECAAEAERLRMDVITEVHGEGEMDRAIALGARIIGINNRNLKTMKVDLGVVARLASSVPEGRAIICESGINSRDDVLSIRASCPRLNAFLVGGSLMKEPLLDLAVRRLLFGRVKICGLTSAFDSSVAYEAGASYGGMVFAAESPRNVDRRVSEGIVASSRMPLVGVFVNENINVVQGIAADLELAVVQLHGDEDEAYIKNLRLSLPEEVEIWRAVHVAGFDADLSKYGADRVLLDTFMDGRRGGTGRAFDWSLLDGVSKGEDFVIAGGITPENAYSAMKFSPHAVDISSGVEEVGKPGKKDQKKIKRLFQNLRG
jgi:indole-3-glycerol phosphate synthase/phosphoribosylanthranilate isomerase